MKTAYLVKLELEEYQAVEHLQRQLLKLRKDGQIPDVVLLLEHKPVITVGKGGGMENVIASPDVLKAQGIDIYYPDRGGNITYHGPGQLVAYPILNLKDHKCDIHWYISRLEQTIIRLLASYNIDGNSVEGRRGVWIDNEKIAAIGVAISRWVTYHGLALNISTNLDHFNHIVPCGLTGFGVTSMKKQLGKEVNINGVRQKMIDQLKDLLDLEFQELSKDEIISIAGIRF